MKKNIKIHCRFRTRFKKFCLIKNVYVYGTRTQQASTIYTEHH